jgi:virginiamycin A acetyltransferase
MAVFAPEGQFGNRPKLMKLALKSLATGLSLILMWPLALLAGFGKFRAGFTGASQMVSLAPGIVGDYLRIAFYRLTLQSCSLRARVSFGTIFSSPEAILGHHVYIGSYCVIGRARIGEHAQIASHVQILSGARQHARDSQGKLLGSERGTFRHVAIGAHSWIGAAAIVMADIGANTTIGAGAVVTKEIPDNVTAVGNPARVIQSQVAAGSLPQ